MPKFHSGSILTGQTAPLAGPDGSAGGRFACALFERYPPESVVRRKYKISYSVLCVVFFGTCFVV